MGAILRKSGKRAWNDQLEWEVHRSMRGKEQSAYSLGEVEESEGPRSTRVGKAAPLAVTATLENAAGGLCQQPVRRLW